MNLKHENIHEYVIKCTNTTQITLDDDFNVMDSNPDIDTSRSRYNLHLVQPQGRYREEADRMIAAAHCRVRKDSVRVVEALVTASPELVGARPLHLAAQDRSVT